MCRLNFDFLFASLLIEQLPGNRGDLGSACTIGLIRDLTHQISLFLHLFVYSEYIFFVSHVNEVYPCLLM